ncbi:GTP cyclohydrolase II [Helicobacter sp. MIT 99-5507]|uniref:GTP cyclohydrolase II n=1 Tax=Helicobacter sp. MIT 99-5507 TaxID=152489 RepID=UPI000E1F3AF5|nr:GTP cyclohydrolase II [Helicobacter sp. MIT 99-5507]RDU58336.1 GTP cyclohydrolase II [Helicobacter sp. MIT 99-5507]
MEVSKQANLPTKFGNFIIQSFREDNNKAEHLVLKSNELGAIPLVRVHSECMTGDVFGSRKCDCGDELEIAMKRIAAENGMIIYLRQEGRGIGLFNKVNAYNLQDNGYDTVEANNKLGFGADLRNYDIVGKIFDYYGIKSIRLLTNNPKKISEISKFVKVQRDSILATPNQYNKEYLKIKQSKLGHLLES